MFAYTLVLPDAIYLSTDIDLGYFASNGVYDLIDQDSAIYVNNEGCKIIKIQGLDSCGTNNCKDLCFDGKCFEVSNKVYFSNTSKKKSRKLIILFLILNLLVFTTYISMLGILPRRQKYSTDNIHELYR